MANADGPAVAVVVRVGTPGVSAFQLRKGEEGLSVFDPDAVDPPLTDDELFAVFRPGSIVVHRPVAQILALGLQVVPVDGADTLPERLRAAHCEITAGPGLDRPAYKRALRELE